MNRHYEVYILNVGDIGYYIGVTSQGYHVRFKKHEYTLKNKPESNIKLYTAMRNNEYSIDVLEEFTSSKDFASSREIYWIAKYKSDSLKICYNVLSGGYAPKGKEHNQARDIAYWTKTSSRLKDFKRTCKVMCWNFEDFTQVFDVKKSCEDVFKGCYYFHFFKEFEVPEIDYKIGLLTTKEVKRIKDKYRHYERRYENIPTCVPAFKKLCDRINIDYSKYRAIPLDEGSLGLTSKFFIYHKDRIPKEVINKCLDLDNIKKISTAGSNNPMFIDIKLCEKEHPVSKASFKRLCKVRKLNPEDFEEKFHSNRLGHIKLYTYTKIN